MTVFLGCGFAAKYREGGGVFSVPLQWMLGLKRLGVDAVWLEVFPGSGNELQDRSAIRAFQAQLRSYGMGKNYCVLYQPQANDVHELDQMDCFGLSARELRARFGGPTTLLNLSYSIHPPLLLEFERRLLCDLDPSEVLYWMTKLEMGQSTHQEFWTIGLNVGAPDCRLPTAALLGQQQGTASSRRQQLPWRTFFPLVDTHFIQPRPKPRTAKFTTIGQWYWGGAVEVNGEFPDLSKKFAFEKYLGLPGRVPEAQFELAMNIAADDPERGRLQERGWRLVRPHFVAKTARLYRRYLASASAEFTAIKGVDVAWRTGWLSDRAAAFLAMGRPVVTEDTGASGYLPQGSGFYFVRDLASAADACREIFSEWDSLSARCRATAVEFFDSERNLRKILGC